MAFKPLAKEASLLRRVECVIKRHDNNYFVGWTDEQLSALDDDVRPSRALDAAEASLVSKNESIVKKNEIVIWCLRQKKRANCAMIYDRGQYVY